MIFKKITKVHSYYTFKDDEYKHEIPVKSDVNIDIIMNMKFTNEYKHFNIRNVYISQIN